MLKGTAGPVSDLIASELRDLYHIIWGLHIASGARDMKLTMMEKEEAEETEGNVAEATDEAEESPPAQDVFFFFSFSI